jgi:hypothetical protein
VTTEDLTAHDSVPAHHTVVVVVAAVGVVVGKFSVAPAELGWPQGRHAYFPVKVERQLATDLVRRLAQDLEESPSYLQDYHPIPHLVEFRRAKLVIEGVVWLGLELRLEDVHSGVKMLQPDYLRWHSRPLRYGPERHLEDAVDLFDGQTVELVEP